MMKGLKVGFDGDNRNFREDPEHHRTDLSQLVPSSSLAFIPTDSIYPIWRIINQTIGLHKH